MSNVWVFDDEQAYTQELEIKVSRLEEENERLRRQKVNVLQPFGSFGYTHALNVVVLKLKE